MHGICWCLREREVQCVRDVEITGVRRQIGAAFSLSSHWMQVQMAKQWEMKGDGDVFFCVR